MNARELEEEVNLRYGQINQVLKYLSVENPAPVIRSGTTWRRTAVPYQMDREKIQRLTEQRTLEWQEVQQYIDHQGCLMECLAEALDDAESQPCGRCAICLGRPILEPTFRRETAVTAARFLRLSELPLVCNKQVARDSFQEYGLRGNLPKDLRAETGRILSRWGDAGWGQVVAQDKHRGHFGDQLVDAVVEMISARWQPEPPPEWVTCIPSRNRPDLVPGFAGRMAVALGLPFEPIVTKVRDNEPQKAQQNRFHQCRNLDGAFAIQGAVPNGPVLLIDDVVDSGWTLTVVSALLLGSGSGRVWPLALATSSMGS